MKRIFVGSWVIWGLVWMLPATAQEWNLARSVERAQEIAPELRAAAAQVDEQQGLLEQTRAWPNPDIELRMDDRLGQEDGSGGIAFTQFSFSQPLPVSPRHRYKIAAADARRQAALVQQRARALTHEAEIARAFHDLQWASAKLQLAQQRLALADTLHATAVRREQAGDLARVERLRWDIMREQAHQGVDREEGKYEEAAQRFRIHLGLPPDTPLRTTPLIPLGNMPDVQILRAALEQHPLLIADTHRRAAAQEEVHAARAERVPDPVLRLFRERDYLADRRQDVTGIGVAFTLPLGKRQRAAVLTARAEQIVTESTAQVQRRELTMTLEQSQAHLAHLLLQAEHFRSRVLAQAQTLLTLTRQAYAAGEVELLALIDANDTYFDAQARHLELLYESWLEVAQLRYAAGLTVSDPVLAGVTP